MTNWVLHEGDWMTLDDARQHVPAPPNGYHPVDAEGARDLYRALAELRHACPVSRPTMEGIEPLTLFTRYDDVATILRDYRSFGNIGFFPSMARFKAVEESRRSIIELDPPVHTAVRRLNLIAMKPAAVTEALPRVHEMATTLVASFAGAGRAELVSEYAVPLPADAITAVLGLPTSDADMIHEWVESTFSEPPAGHDRPPDAPALGRNEDFDRYLLEQLAWRRATVKPPDDAITRMLEFESDDGTTFTDEQLVNHIRTLLMAGNETTTSLISNTIYRLLTFPGALGRLRDDRDLVEPFIEECLRFDTPLTQFPRRVRTDVDVAGVKLEPDDLAVVSVPSANHDESHFGADADEFRLDRFVGRAADHLSFGLGVHHCVGAFLARATARIALETLLDLVPDLAPAPDFDYDKVWFFEFWRPRRLDVVFAAG